MLMYCTHAVDTVLYAMLLCVVRTDVPGSITSLVIAVSGSNAQASWSLPSNLTSQLTAYNITYTIIGIGDCSNLTGKI